MGSLVERTVRRVRLALLSRAPISGDGLFSTAHRRSSADPGAGGEYPSTVQNSNGVSSMWISQWSPRSPRKRASALSIMSIHHLRVPGSGVRRAMWSIQILTYVSFGSPPTKNSAGENSWNLTLT